MPPIVHDGPCTELKTKANKQDKHRQVRKLMLTDEPDLTVHAFE